MIFENSKQGLTFKFTNWLLLYYSKQNGNFECQTLYKSNCTNATLAVLPTFIGKRTIYKCSLSKALRSDFSSFHRHSQKDPNVPHGLNESL